MLSYLPVALASICGPQTTWDRLLPLTGAGRLRVVASPSHVKSISDHLPDLVQDNFCKLGSKDFMAAIGLAAAILAQRDPDAVIRSFAADHMISGTEHPSAPTPTLSFPAHPK